MRVQTTHLHYACLCLCLKCGLILFCLLIAGASSVAPSHALSGSFPKPASVIPVKQTATWTRSWWMPRHNAKVARVRRGDVGLLMIGDSITHGWETVGREVWQHYYQRRRAINLGFNGDRTEHVLWRLMNGELVGAAPKLAVVMLGTNNSGDGRAPEDTAAGIRRIVQELRWRLPTTKILLLAIFPTGATPDNNVRRTNGKVNLIIADLHDGRQLFFLDINHVFLDRHQNLPRTVMPDLLHPNAEGYRRWAEAMEPMVHRLMGDEAVSPQTERLSGRIPLDGASGWPPPKDDREICQAALGVRPCQGLGIDAIR